MLRRCCIAALLLLAGAGASVRPAADSYWHCQHCGAREEACEVHYTGVEYADGATSELTVGPMVPCVCYGPLCQECWNKLPAESRLPYYRAEFESQRAKSEHCELAGTDCELFTNEAFWELVQAAVLHER